jgi:uncharacterized repeat protein (TIGR02543 family)
MTGYDGAFRPLDTITRAEFVALLDQSIEGYITEPGTYTADDFSKSKGVIIINAPDVVLEGVTADYAIVTPIADGTEINNSDIDRGVKNLSSTEVNADDSVVVDNSDKIVSQSTQTPTATDESVATEAPETTKAPEKTTVPNATSSAATTKPNKTSSSSSGSGSVRKYTVTLDANGGTFTSGDTLDIRVAKNKTLTEQTTEPTREGYTFTGWYTDKEATTAYDLNTAVKSNMTIYAGWKADGTDDTEQPTVEVTTEPTSTPTVEPTVEVTTEPTATPTIEPTATPTVEPIVEQTTEPTATPTVEPTAAPKATVTASTIHDQSETINDADICDANSYKIEETTGETDTYRTITISATNLKKHTNDEQTKGYWVGATITAPEDRQLKAYSFSTTEPTGEVQFTPFDTAHKSEPFYLDVSANTVKWVVVKYDDDTTETFKLDASDVTMYQAPATVTEATIHDQSEAILDADLCDTDSYAIEETPANGETYRTIKISATNLKKHENGEGNRGYWVGATIKAPEDRTITAYSFSTITPLTPIFTDFDSARTSEPFYLDVSENTVKWVVVKYDNGTTETFKLDASDVTMYQAPATVSASTIHDQSGNIADGELCDADTYKVLETTAENAETYRTITITATNLKKHENGEGNEGYWVGATITAPEDRQLAAYYFSTEQPSDSPNFTPFDTERDSEPFYLDVSENDTKWVVVKYDNETTETFKLDASGVTMYQEPTTTSYIVTTDDGRQNESGDYILAAGTTLGNTALVEVTNALDTKITDCNETTYDGTTYSKSVVLCAEKDDDNGGIKTYNGYTYLTIKPKKSGTITFITKDYYGIDVELYESDGENLYSRAENTAKLVGKHSERYCYIASVTAHLEAGKTYVLVSGMQLDFYGYTFTADQTTSYKVKTADGEQNENEDYILAENTTLLGNTDLVEVKNTSEVQIGECSITIDDETYSNYIDLRSWDLMKIDPNDDVTYLEIKPKTSGTITFVTQRFADADEGNRDVKLYKMNDDDDNDSSLKVDTKITEVGDKVIYEETGDYTVEVTVTAQLEAGKTYYLTAAAWSSAPFYGYTYTTYISDDHDDDDYEDDDDDEDDTAEPTTTSASYQVTGEFLSTIDAGTKLGDTSLIKVTNAADTYVFWASEFTVNGKSYTNCVDLYTPHYSLKEGIFQEDDDDGTYLTIKPKKSGTATFITDEKDGKDVELYVKNEDGSYSKVDDILSEKAATANEDQGYYRMAVTAHLDADKTYILTATEIWLGFYGYTYEIDPETTSYIVTDNDDSTLTAGTELLGNADLVEVKNASDVSINSCDDDVPTVTVDGETYSNYIYLYTQDSVDFQTSSSGTYLEIKPKKSGTITFIVREAEYEMYGESRTVGLYKMNELSSIEVDAEREELTNKVYDDMGNYTVVVAVTAQLEADQTYRLATEWSYVPFYGYTYTTEISDDTGNNEEVTEPNDDDDDTADLTVMSASYNVNENNGKGFAAGDTLGDDTSLIKVTTVCDIRNSGLFFGFELDGNTYRQEAKLYTPHYSLSEGIFQAESTYTYLTINPKKSGTLKLIAGRNRGNDVELYVKNDDNSYSLVDTTIEEVDSRDDIVTVTAHLEKGKTYVLTSTKTSNGVYGYTYEADTSTSYKVSGEAYSDLDAGTLGDTSLIEVTNMKNVVKWPANEFTTDDITYDRCIDLYTPTYDLDNGTFEMGDESYITINSKIDGTVTFIADRKVQDNVLYDMELFVKNEEDGSYSSVAFKSSEAKADDTYGNYRMAYTVQLEAGKTYVLTATQATKLGFYGYTYTADTSSGDSDVDHDNL